jgi:hypothetical protein
MTNLWQTCRLATATRHIAGLLYRLVESQEQVATMHLVDSLEAQSLLEEMLEAAKPQLAPGSEKLHYLLHSPFRYPPLKYGSRFGARHEPSLFYGAHTPATVLAESAYYRYVFWHGMQSAPPAPIRSEHTLFSARYATARGLQLQHDPCAEQRAILTHPADYTATQALGSAMRDAAIDAFEFPSARCPEGGINVALFTPAAFAARRPREMQQWLGETGAEEVTFAHAHNRALHHFPIDTFMVDGVLPWPAG